MRKLYYSLMGVGLVGLGIVYAEASPEFYQHSKLVAHDAGFWHEFGMNVELNGPIALVGAGVAGLEPNSKMGAVYIVDVSDVFNPKELAKIESDTPQLHDWFGDSIASQGVIAAMSESHRSDPNSGGFVYLYDLTNPSKPVKLAKFSASDTGNDDVFGYSVAIEGELLLVGSPKSLDSPSGPGSAYLFDISDPTHPVEIQKIIPSGGAGARDFGVSVDLQGSTAVIGSWRDEGTGAMYLYNIAENGQAELNSKILASDGEQHDFFGFQVELEGSLVFASAHGDNGIDGSETGSGSVYIYDITDPLSPIERLKLYANDAAGHDRFSRDFDVFEDTVIVGAPNARISGRYNLLNEGACYFFDISDPSNPVQTSKVFADDGSHFASLGWVTAIDDRIAISGAFRDNEVEDRAGALYLFDYHNLDSCHADLNLDGSLDFFDISALINRRTDYNGDLVFDINDIKQFLDDLAVGCVRP